MELLTPPILDADLFRLRVPGAFDRDQHLVGLISRHVEYLSQILKLHLARPPLGLTE